MKNILVVEDNETLRYFYRIFLAVCFREEGTAITAVETAVEGVRKLEEESFDIVLTDFNTPEGNGHDVIRQAAGTVGKIILLTGQADPNEFRQIAETAMLLGAHGVLSKPFENFQLMDLLKAA